jgi:hypothetical protein
LSYPQFFIKTIFPLIKPKNSCFQACFSIFLEIVSSGIELFFRSFDILVKDERKMGVAKMNIQKLILTLIISVLLLQPVSASISRLYVGELDSQFMAGVDIITEFDGLYVGGDVRTIIGKAVVNEEDRTVGFLPDRTDYKVLAGIDFGDGWSVEVAHVCYHQVISSTDLSLYQDVNEKQLANTDILTIKYVF